MKAPRLNRIGFRLINSLRVGRFVGLVLDNWKVGRLLVDHFKTMKKSSRDLDEASLKFTDAGPESDSDSGLEDLLGKPS